MQVKSTGKNEPVLSNCLYLGKHGSHFHLYSEEEIFSLSFNVNTLN